MKPLDSSATPHSRVYAALLELVECKDLKDSTEADFYADEPMLTTDQRNECRAEYERRKPLAWEAARKVLTECVPSETGAMEFADNTATKAIVSASTPKEGEIEENLTEIEDAIWNATGSALLSGEKAGAADKSIIYRSLCAAGNKVAYVRELLTARSSTALPEPAKDLQEANEIIEILRGELARVAIAVGRTKDGTGYDLDWFALHKDIPAPRSAIGDMEWRDAERERPHRDRLVIAWTKEYGALLADRSTRNPHHGWSCCGTVTHWMPLPPVPSVDSRSDGA